MCSVQIAARAAAAPKGSDWAPRWGHFPPPASPTRPAAPKNWVRNVRETLLNFIFISLSFKDTAQHNRLKKKGDHPPPTFLFFFLSCGRCLLRGPSGASGGEAEDRGQEALGGRRLCRRRAGRRPAARVDASFLPSDPHWTAGTFHTPVGHLCLVAECLWSTVISLQYVFICPIWIL